MIWASQYCRVEGDGEVQYRSKIPDPIWFKSHVCDARMMGKPVTKEIRNQIVSSTANTCQPLYKIGDSFDEWTSIPYATGCLL